MSIIDLHTFKQLINIKNGMYEIIITNSDYQHRLDIIYKELDNLIMDITECELEN